MLQYIYALEMVCFIVSQSITWSILFPAWYSWWTLSIADPCYSSPFCMARCVRAGKQSRSAQSDNAFMGRHSEYVSIIESCGVNRYTARCESPVSMIWQCMLTEGWGNGGQCYLVATLAKDLMCLYTQLCSCYLLNRNEERFNILPN